MPTRSSCGQARIFYASHFSINVYSTNYYTTFRPGLTGRHIAIDSETWNIYKRS